MYKGIYIALSGAVLKHTQIEVMSRNISNADNAGYKRELVSFKDYLVSDDFSFSQDKTMTDISKLAYDLSTGDLVKTGKKLDIAIDGNGFIELEGNRYTRKGSMKIDRDGYLSINGYRVMGESGPIRLNSEDVEINEAGDIYIKGTLVDSIRTVEFSVSDFTKIGDSTFSTNSQPFKSNSIVKQGYIERSNVKIIKEMVSMIEAMREFEAFQKIIQGFDDASSKVTNEMARV